MSARRTGVSGQQSPLVADGLSSRKVPQKSFQKSRRASHRHDERTERSDRSARARAARAAVSGVTVRPTPEEQKNVTLPGGHEFSLSRRHFLIGAAGVASLATVAGGSYIMGSRKAEAADVTALTVSEGAVTSSADFSVIEDPETVMHLVTSLELPYGTLVWANDGAIAACLIPTDTASPLNQIGLISLPSGTHTTVLENAVGSNDGYEIYDVRACAGGLIWSEANILENTWRIYSATSDGSTLGTPVLADEGDYDWEMPALAATSGYGFWQRTPRTDGSNRKEPSTLRRVLFGDTESMEIYRSAGRMAAPPTVDRNALVITPRADVATSNYQLTYLDAVTGEVLDKLVLPSSMRPYEAGYGKNGFIFAFDSIYDYGDGISNLGTYTPLETPSSNASHSSTSEEDSESGVSASARTEAYSSLPWFRYALDPSAASSPAWCGDWMIVKTQYQVGGVNLGTHERFNLEAPNGTEDFGDYLASTGIGNQFVTYANMDYTTLDGATYKHCLVRVWAPATE